MKFEVLQSYVTKARTLNVDWGSTRYILDRKTRADFEALIDELAGKGMTVAQRHTIGENNFATLRSDDGDVAVSYFNFNHTICLVTDELCDGKKAPTLTPASYEKLTTPKLAFIGLDYSNPEKDGNGMSYVLTLADGSFIVYDGGYAEDAAVLLDYLDKNNVRSEKPRIAAWVLTHSHGDHYWALKYIADNCPDRVTVEEFVMNPRFSRYEFEQYEGWLGEVFPRDVLPKFEGAVIVKPHAGQKLYYRDAELEILHTQEEMLPNQFRWMNEISLITRVYLGGQRILFPADGEIGTDVSLPVMYGDALESEFIQQPHHGFSGGSYTLYDLVRPMVCMFTCNQVKFDKYTAPTYGGGKNAYLVEISKETYHAGMGTTVFELPYTPKADK